MKIIATRIVIIIVLIISSFSIQAQKSGKSKQSQVLELKRYVYLVYALNCTKVCDNVVLDESGLKQTFENTSIWPRLLDAIADYAKQLSDQQKKIGTEGCNCLSKAIEFYDSQALDMKIKALLKSIKLYSR